MHECGPHQRKVAQCRVPQMVTEARCAPPQATNAVVDAVNRIPLVSTFLEVVGLVRCRSPSSRTAL